MSEARKRHAGAKLERHKSGNAFGDYRYFSYTRAQGWDEGKFKITGSAYTLNSESLSAMFPWISFFIPKRMRKEDGFSDIEYQAFHLTNAMGELEFEIKLMMKERKHMSNMLDNFVNSIKINVRRNR